MCCWKVCSVHVITGLNKISLSITCKLYGRNEADWTGKRCWQAVSGSIHVQQPFSTHSVHSHSHGHVHWCHCVWFTFESTVTVCLDNLFEHELQLGKAQPFPLCVRATIWLHASWTRNKSLWQHLTISVFVHMNHLLWNTSVVPQLSNKVLFKVLWLKSQTQEIWLKRWEGSSLTWTNQPGFSVQPALFV